MLNLLAQVFKACFFPVQKLKISTASLKNSTDMSTASACAFFQLCLPWTINFETTRLVTDLASFSQTTYQRQSSESKNASTRHPHICQLVSLSSPMKRPLVGHYHPETPQRQLASHLNWLENPQRRDGIKDEEFLVFFLRRWVLDFLLCSSYLVAHYLRELKVLINSYSIQQRLWSQRLY